MPRRLLVNRIDQIERVLRKVPLVRFRVNPNRKEFCPQVAAPCLVQTHVPNIARIGRAHVEPFVQKPLRRVGMSIDNNRRFLNSSSLSAHRLS